MRKLFGFLALTGTILAAGTSGAMASDETVLISTYPAVRAHCLVENERSRWDLNDTPYYLTVERSDGPLSVTCHSYDGHYSGAGITSSSLDGRATLGLVATGAAVGGALAATGTAPVAVAAAAAGGTVVGGGAVSSFIGNAYRYPDGIVVPMIARPSQIVDARPVTPSPIPPVPVIVEQAPPPEPAPAPVVHHTHHAKAHHVKAKTCP